jgi:pimeloyl-ACP methyl ester carboxylesterase
MKRRALRILGATLIVLSLASFFGCQAIQRKVLFFPSNHANANGFTRWEHEGATIGYAREVAEPKNVWLMLHGNGGQAADRAYAMHAFDERDAVYILEYPGYGQRAGAPSRRAFDAAAREGYAILRARFPGKPVCVLGESLGSGPASMLSREKPMPDKIVLVVPFDAITTVARGHVRYLPVGLILAGTWDNVDALKGYTGPIEIFGAEHDEVIPVKHARALAESLPQAKFHLIPINHGWANLRGIAFRNP